jgi:hypothetical protein
MAAVRVAAMEAAPVVVAQVVEVAQAVVAEQVVEVAQAVAERLLRMASLALS